MKELQEAFEALQRLRPRLESKSLKDRIARIQLELIELQETLTLLEDSGYRP